MSSNTAIRTSLGGALLDEVLRSPATASAARFLLCLPFWWSGLTKLVDFSGGTAEMAHVGLPAPALFNALTVLVQLGGSALVTANVWTWLGAGALGVFTVFASLGAHRFWTLQGSAYTVQLSVFLEHLAIVGGFALVSILSARGASSPADSDHHPEVTSKLSRP